jgi:hypothetical protein
MGLTDSQKQALYAEASFYESLTTLLDSGKAPDTSPAPISRNSLDEIRARLDRWLTRSKEAEEMDLDPRQRADLDRTNRAASALKAYIASYPVADN